MQTRRADRAPKGWGAILAVVLLASSPSLSEAQPADAGAGPDSAATQALLLDGVRAFRAEHYEDALRIFKRVEADKSPADIGFYLGMVLHKLGRHAEALTVFRAAHRAGLREPVADYYQAVSAYRLGLFGRARQGFQALLACSEQPAACPASPSGATAPMLGPRLQQGARSFLQAVELALTETVDGSSRPLLLRRYEIALGRATALPAGSEDEALEWLDEAVQLFGQLPERATLLPGLRQALQQLGEALRGKPAAADVKMLWAQSGA